MEDKVLNDISKSVAFVIVSTHMWRGLYKINNAKVVYAGEAMKKDLVVNPRWDLMPKHWRERFSEIDGAVKGVIHKYCVENPETDTKTDQINNVMRKFPIRGVHVVPRKKMVEFFDEVTKIETDRFEPAVDTFVLDWPNIVTELSIKVKDQPSAVWVEMKQHLPQAADLKSRFWIEKIIAPITLNSDVTLEGLTGKEATDYIQEIKGYGQRFTTQVAEMIMHGLEDELKGAVDNLTNRISDGGVIKEGTLNMVRVAFDKLSSFDFVMTPELKSKMAITQTTLNNYSAKEFNSELKENGAQSITMKLSEYLKDVKEQCHQESRVYHRNYKNIKV